MADRLADGLKQGESERKGCLGVGGMKSLIGYRREIRVGGYVWGTPYVNHSHLRFTASFHWRIEWNFNFNRYGLLRIFRVSIYPAIASSLFFSALSQLSPSEMQPGFF
jgi:hypothetical protein